MLRTYFISYQKNNGGAVVKLDDEHANDRISRGNLWIFTKEKKLDKNITAEDVTTLVRLINLEIMNRKGEINYLLWPGFKHFLTQLATMAFPELNHLPPAFAIEKLINHLGEIDKEDPKLSKIFKDPEYAGTDDLDLI